MGYTASDLLGVGIGFLLFALFAFAPGYTFASLTNVFDFRRRRLITRLTVAIPLSIGLTPITTYLLWRCSLPFVWIVFAASGAICIALLAHDARFLKLHLSRAGCFVLAIAAGWLIVASLSLIDIQLGNRLYFPFSTHDLATHTAFAAAIARFGVPPHNPFFFAGQPAPLRYHYFWYIPCALVDLLGGSIVTARLAVIASILWVGLGFMAILALYLRFFQDKGDERIERRTLIAVSLIGIAGLDIVPVMIADAFGGVLMPTIDWWTERNVVWSTTMLWSPHDLAALSAGLIGFLLVWDAARCQQPRERIGGFLGGGLAFASAAGSSIYMGATLAAACMLWVAIALLHRWWRHALMLAAAGGLSAILIAPFAFQLAHGKGGPNASGHSLPFTLSVRPFSVIEELGRNANPAKLQVLYAAFLPLNYFFQYGFFFVVGCLAVRRIWRHRLRSQTEWAAATLGIVSLVICTFVRSTVIKNNDLGWVSSFLVMFILMLWASEMWNEGTLGLGRRPAGETGQRRAAPRLVAATLVLGAMGTCYEVCMQRAFPILSDSYAVQTYGFLSNDRQLGRRTFELRHAFQEIDRLLPANDVVQPNPHPDLGDLPAQMYSGRQMVADVGNCGTTFGGSEKFCNDVILPRLKPLFEDGDPITLADAEQTCREFSITALLFEGTDPVWKDKSSWIWESPALISNDFVRVIPCGKR